MNIFAVSLILNAVAVVVIKMQYDHVKRLQKLVQPMEPMEFGGLETWYDCDYVEVLDDYIE